MIVWPYYLKIRNFYSLKEEEAKFIDSFSQNPIEEFAMLFWQKYEFVVEVNLVRFSRITKNKVDFISVYPNAEENKLRNKAFALCLCRTLISKTVTSFSGYKNWIMLPVMKNDLVIAVIAINVNGNKKNVSTHLEEFRRIADKMSVIIE